jgi:NAD(P)-dependent dehydrogenase (short-subunit alcohol dehydrogenase family)
MADKVWFITGCSSGFGRELALAALEQGDLVIATARNVDALAELTKNWPQNCHAVALDLNDRARILAAVEEAIRVFGRIDVLVNNAGYGLVGAIEEASWEQIEQNFAVNFFGPLALIRAMLPHFRERKCGHVVNMSAAAAISNYAGFGIYGAAKCALEGMSEALALEGQSFGLKVTLVQPGPFRTDFVARSLDRTEGGIPEYSSTAGRFQRLIESMHGKQPGDPARAAQAIVQAVDADRPPMRLVLGKYAIEKARRDWRRREAELREWEDTGMSADGPYL